MVALSQYNVAVDSTSPESATFTLSSARAVMPLYLLSSDLGHDPTVQDIQDAIQQILGGLTSTNSTDGRLTRTPPLAHPQYNWLYASAISNIRGIGAPVKTAAGAALEVPSLPNLALYPNYEFIVEFTPRPYVVAKDASIPLLKGQKFYDESNTQQTTVIAAEWIRYAWWQPLPQYDSITARFGQMVFQTQSGGEPQNIPFPGMPRLFLPNQILKIYWSQVPLRYIYSSNSFLTRFGGYVNQTTFTTWKPGQLLYLGCTPKPYTPPVQQLDSLNFGSSGFIVSAEKWCDIEMNFLLTTRQVQDGPTPTANGNFIATGHNVHPWPGSTTTTGGFFYATVKSGLSAKQKPVYPSTEFGLLFTDPDAPNVYQFPNTGAGS